MTTSSLVEPSAVGVVMSFMITMSQKELHRLEVTVQRSYTRLRRCVS